MAVGAGVAVVDVFGPDPFVDRHLRELLGPGVSPMRREWRVAEHQVLLDRIASLDEELGDLAMERRWMVGRLERIRDDRWPLAMPMRRRRPPFDLPPVPPPVPNAQRLHGAELRATCLAILGRHGPMTLPDLDGYLRRYGYVVGGNRPVQRLGDCMAFEARAGRARRVRRGAYAAAGPLGSEGRLAGLAPEPWSDEPGDGPDGVPVDASLQELPERWQPSSWDVPDGGDPPDDLEDDVHDEVLQVLVTYVEGRRRDFRARHGARDPRAHKFSPFGGDSSAIRPRRAPQRGGGDRGAGAGGGGGSGGATGPAAGVSDPPGGDRSV